MNRKIITALRCPICKDSLQRKEKMYSCKNKHCFDVAKEGYVNLLLPNQKHSKNPGDSKEMLVSRKDFLNKGYYNKLSDEVNAAVFNSYEGNTGILSIIDIGCGEGYYLSNFISDVNEKEDLQVEAYGMDIAKDAIRLAAKRTKDVNWLVGNIINLPFADKSLDVILCMFSIANFEECKRILKDDGKLIFVTAGDNHLKQLKEIVYQEITQSKESSLDKQKVKFFKKSELLKVSYDVLLKEVEDIKNLLKMTPHYWKIKEEKREELYEYSQLNVTIDVNIEILMK